MTGAVPAAHHVAWIGLGSNLDNPAHHLRDALADIRAVPGVALLAGSRLYRTRPVGGPTGQPDFCNACAALACDMPPLALLDALQAIENAHGRVRDIRWGPRTLDLDILAYDDRTMTHPRLRLPHPRATSRAFVLVPLVDIAPTLELDGARVIDWLAGIERADVTDWDTALGGAP